MRITTGMLNMARRKSGLPARGSSLLNYVKQNGRGGSSSRLSVRNAAGAGRAAQLEKANYEKLAKTADELTAASKELMAGVDGENGETIEEAAASLVKSYNETLKNLKSASGMLNEFYRQSLRDIAVSDQDALAEIGITVASDGSLKLDKEKLAGADAEKVKKLLGTSGSFTGKVGQIASRVADNAEAGRASISSRYDISGRVASSYLSRFNSRI